MSAKPLIITVDGPAGSGKSTASRLVARRLGLPYLNSGALYRAVTLAVVEAGGGFEDAARVESIVRDLDFRIDDDRDRGMTFLLGGRDVTDRIKDPDVTSQVYRIANEPAYRALLVDRQRQFAGERGLVAEGRDMGTVIFPEARVKVFLDAPPEERARRQCKELRERGVAVEYEELLSRIRERDERDRNRASAPLRAAPDAVLVDSGGKTIEQVVDRILDLVRRPPAP